MSDVLDGRFWHFNPFAIGPIGAFMLSILFATTIWTRRVSRQRQATFAPVAMGVGVWNLCVALVSCTSHEPFAMWLSHVTVSIVVVTCPLAISFVTAFGRLRHRTTIVLISALSAIVGVAWIWLVPGGIFARLRVPPWGGLYPIGSPPYLLPVGIAIANVILALTISIRVWRRTPPSRRRRQAAYVVLSYVAAILGGVDALGGYGYDVPPLAWIASSIANVLVYYAIVRFQLMDVRTAAHRTLFWALVVAVTFLPLYAIALWTRDWPGWHEPWSRLLAVGVLLALLHLYLVRSDRAISDLLGRRRRRGLAIAERFAARALDVRRPEDLLPPLGEALREGAGLELQAVLLSIDESGGTGVREYQVLPEAAPRAPLAPTEDLPTEPLARAELDPEEPQPLDRACEKLLLKYRADAIVPMRHGATQIGAILARATDGGGADLTLDEEQRELLGRLGARAAVVFTNATLYDALERRSAGLEREVQVRTRKLADAVEQLKAAQARLVQAERQSSLGLLVAGVSHEINNALNFIFGNLPMLAKYAETYDELLRRAAAAGVAPPPELERRAAAARAALGPALAAIEDAARRARQIVDDLRRFARHDEAERKVADIREGLESTLNLLGAELRGRIRIERRYDPDVPLVDCFPAALNHVFLNVLLNAAQAIDGEGTIRIDVRRDGGERVLVAIADSGRGVAAEDRERVFEPFFTTRKRAAGLGLAVSRQIVDRHGGRIALEGNPDGRGSVVSITLPTSRV